MITLNRNIKTKLCYTDNDNFIIHIKTEDFYKDIANDVEKWFGTNNYDENDKRPLPVGKNKKMIGLFKDELFTPSPPTIRHKRVADFGHQVAWVWVNLLKNENWRQKLFSHNVK